MANPLPGKLYAITTQQHLHDLARLLHDVETLLKAGVRLIQYRAKATAQITSANKLQHAHALAALCRLYQAKLIINDDPYLAQAAGAAGVHLGQQDMPIREARQILGPHAMIGQTCHNSLTLAQRACDQGADYLAFGRCFPSTTKPEASPASLAIFMQAAPLSLPLVAIGGITPMNAPKVLQAGAHILAISAGFFATPNPQQAVQTYLDVLDQNRTF